MPDGSDSDDSDDEDDSREHEKGCRRRIHNATDCADFLVSKGLPFRDAYKATGELVALCIKKGTTLEELPIEEYKSICPLFDEGVYDAINLENCVTRRGM